MINHISIENFAIIQNTEIDFDEGLNIITGETGAGKSIVIEAISLALGSRADTNYVRHGTNKAIVQLAAEIDGEDIVITREVSSNGKNLCKLNGQLVTLGELSETCHKIADIHGQYDNQSLLNPDNHIDLIDSYQSNTIDPIKNNFIEQFDEYSKLKSKLNSLLSVERENIKKTDFFKYEKNEIDNANLHVGEDDELSDKISLLQNSEKIFEAIKISYSAINDSEANATTLLSSALHSMQEISQFSNDVSNLTEELSDIFYRLEDVSNGLRDIKESITFTPDELDIAIARLDLLENIKKKYGPTIDEVLQYRDKISVELEQIENYDEIKSELEKQVNQSYEKLIKQANFLTEARKSSANSFELKVEQELSDLNFETASIKVDFKTPVTIGRNGNDIVELLISTNKGEPPKPLVKIASGGEISRIMLAIKNITGTYDNIPTMIFDEIDAGISGVTASIVGRKLKEISSNHQILCITHLPQIAAVGNSNYRIYKETKDDSTFTYVEKLSSVDKINEVARLLGGETITEITRKNAEELINRS